MCLTNLELLIALIVAGLLSIFINNLIHKFFGHQNEARNINENEQKEKVCKGDKVMGYYLVSEEKRKELFNIK